MFKPLQRVFSFQIDGITLRSPPEWLLSASLDLSLSQKRSRFIWDWSVEIFTRGSLFLWFVRGEKDLLMFCSIKLFFFPFVFSRFYITGSDGEILSGSKNSVSSYHMWVFETTFPLSWRVADIDNYVHRRSKYKRTFHLLDWENSLEVWSPLDRTKSKTAP